MDEVYYRIGMRDGEIFIACMQWFDEYDYDESRWLTEEKFYAQDEHDEWGQYQGYVSGEQKAKEWLIEQGKRSDIPLKVKLAINNMKDEMFTNCLD